MELEHVRGILDDCTNRNDFGELGKRLDEAELMNPDAFETAAWPHTMHLLSHLIAQDLPNARFMFKRIPEAIKSEDIEIRKVHMLLQLLWNRKYRDVWEMVHASWPSQYATAIKHLSLSTRREIFRMLQVAYTRIRVEKLSFYLGCSIDEACLYSTGLGARQEGNVVVMPSMPTEDRLPEGEIQKLQSILVQLGQ